MRYVLSSKEPAGGRLLLIESGSRSLAESMVPHLDAWPKRYVVDLVTCYAGLPSGFAPETEVFRVADYGKPELRAQLLNELRSRDYACIGLICSGEPIMTKWKWMLALRIPAKVFVINENGDYFWLNRENFPIVRQFALVRAGLYGSDSVRTITRILIFPFTLAFLLLYAFIAHSRRYLRRAFRARVVPSQT